MQRRFERLRRGAIIGSVAGAMLCSNIAHGQTTPEHDFNLEAQSLGQSLREVAKQAGLELIANAKLIRERRAAALKGHFSTEAALESLLRGSGLVAEISDGVVIIRGRSEPPGTTVAGTADAESDIVVTGSHLKGAPPASPLLTWTQKQIEDAGMSNLGDVIRSIPQNFNGGQNPGVGFSVPAGSGENNGGGSSINLRGLGPDATLTLLNGHRLSYGSNRQSIDISAIPVAALDRIEILTDGASAVYGSDAVAGVANIILKRDFDGLSTSARFGAATDGGDTQQQFSAVAGQTWAGGGFLLAYDYGRDTAIVARQRSYTASVSPGLTLLPSQRHHGAVLNGHQSLSETLSFEIDAVYNWRRSYRELSITGEPGSPIQTNPSKASALTVSPALNLALPSDWNLSLRGVYGFDHIHYGTGLVVDGVETTTLSACTCNEARSVDLNLSGPVFRLPGGTAKVAIGGGYRSNRFKLITTIGAGTNINESQGTYYGFGEISLPVVSPDQAVRFVNRLNISAALRYENYPGIDHVTTPKLGIVYSPIDDVDLKISWGKSFKAPTLYQLYADRYALQYTAASRGGSGYPASATVLLLSGANPALKPERATTWSASLVARPHFLPESRFELTYFDIKYRNRAVTPIIYTTQALSDPAYADLVRTAPSPSDLATVLEGRDFFDLTGLGFDPANVVAIVDNSNLNAATQSIRGVDISAEQRISLGRYGAITAMASMSYIDSQQRLSDLQPVTRLAGTLFNPPHFRGRWGLIWENDPLSIASYLNYTGGVDDQRLAIATSVASQTTLDLAARFRVTEGPKAFRNVEISLSLQNILNDKPGPIRTTVVYETPYDSTNYSPIGRFISLSIMKSW